MKKNDWPISAKKAKKEGKPVSKNDLSVYTKNFQKAIENGDIAKSFDTPYGKREAEFFGRERISELLAAADKAATKAGNECVGIRFYYGLAYEELNEKEGTSKISTKPISQDSTHPRLFLVGVDQNGDDIEIDLAQLKDGGGNGLGDGIPKPPY
ncbi:MAG: hypothetical protein NWQ46_04725 [Spirosomaceae bacterium]|nr:hypothetical protein [Spirosomataceae bacterium]